MASGIVKIATNPMEMNNNTAGVEKKFEKELATWRGLPNLDAVKLGKGQPLGDRYLNDKKFSSAVEIKLRKAAVSFAPKTLEDFPSQNAQCADLHEKASDARHKADSAEYKGNHVEAFDLRQKVELYEKRRQAIIDSLSTRMGGDRAKLQHIKLLYDTLIRNDGHHSQADELYYAMTHDPKHAVVGPCYSLAELNAIKARAPAGLSASEAIAWWETVGRAAEEAERRAAEEAEWHAREKARAAAAAEEATLMRHANSILKGTGFVPAIWRERATARAEEIRAENARQQAAAKAERDAEADAAIARQGRGETIPMWLRIRCDKRRAELAAEHAQRAATEFPTLCTVPIRAARVWGAAMTPAAAASPPVVEAAPEPALATGGLRLRVIDETELEELTGTKARAGLDHAHLFAGLRRATEAANREHKRMEAYLTRPLYERGMSLAEWEDWQEECAEEAAAEEEREAWKEFNRQLSHMPQSATIFIDEYLPAGATVEDAWALLDEWEQEEYLRSAGKLPYDEDDDDWEPTPDDDEAPSGGAGTSAGARNGKTQRITVDPSEKLGMGPARNGRKGDGDDDDGW